VKALLPPFFQQLRRNWLAVLLTLGFGVAVLVGVWVAGHRLGSKVTVDFYFRDPAAIAKLPFYTGLVSNMGVLVWGGCAALCLLTYAAVKRLAPAAREWRRFFLMGGVLTALLVTDDLFMVHEELIPEVLFPKKGGLFHIKEGAVMIAYMVYELAFLWRCRYTILRRTDFALLAIGLGGLFGSILADKAGLKHLVSDKTTRVFIEDGLKFLGILGWTLYFAHTALQVLTRPQLREPEPAAPKVS